MRVGIVGGSGFIGSAVKKQVLKRGWEPICIGTRTPRDVFKSADAFVHSVGAISPYKEYKSVLNTKVSDPKLLLTHVISLLSSFARPTPSMAALNYDPLNRTIETIKAQKTTEELQNLPFVYLSAGNWWLASNEYLNSKREGEQLLLTQPFRSVVIRPKFVAPGSSQENCTLRTGIQRMLELVDPETVVNVDCVASAVCDAIMDTQVRGVVNHEMLRVYNDLV